jgi:hypothetical protein
MPFIPFVDAKAKPHELRVAAEHVETAKMVMKNQLLEILLDYLLGKPNNEQTAYEADQITMQYWKDLVTRGGIEW